MTYRAGAEVSRDAMLTSVTEDLKETDNISMELLLLNFNY